MADMLQMTFLGAKPLWLSETMLNYHQSDAEKGLVECQLKLFLSKEVVQKLNLLMVMKS